MRWRRLRRSLESRLRKIDWLTSYYLLLAKTGVGALSSLIDPQETYSGSVNETIPVLAFSKQTLLVLLLKAVAKKNMRFWLRQLLELLIYPYHLFSIRRFGWALQTSTQGHGNNSSHSISWRKWVRVAEP